jgi:hypothetical protein
MLLQDIYRWEIETSDGKIYTEGYKFNPDTVVRVSFISDIFPRHDIIITDNVKFRKRFGRGIIKQTGGFGLKEYLHCAVFDKFRMYVKSSNGQCIITPSEYELY